MRTSSGEIVISTIQPARIAVIGCPGEKKAPRNLAKA